MKMVKTARGGVRKEITGDGRKSIITWVKEETFQKEKKKKKKKKK